MEKWLILGLRQGIQEMNLEGFVVPASKEMLKKTNNPIMSKRHRSPSEELSMAKAKTI